MNAVNLGCLDVDHLLVQFTWNLKTSVKIKHQVKMKVGESQERAVSWETGFSHLLWSNAPHGRSCFSFWDK